MAVVFKNNAKTTLASGVNSSATSITVSDGSVFPSLTGSDIFFATLDDGTNNEIVKVTAVSSNTLTVVRAQESTTARSFSTGDEAQLRLTAGILGLFSQTGVAITDEIEAYLDANGLTFPDGVIAKFGASNDLEIFHDGTNSRIKEVGTGNLLIDGQNAVNIRRTDNGAAMGQFNAGGAVKLFHNASEKFATTSTGIDVTGISAADNLHINSTSGQLKISRNGSSNNGIYWDRLGTQDAAIQVASNEHLNIDNNFGNPINLRIGADGSETTYLSASTSGIDVTGNVVVSGTVDGRDIATDGTKLDGIEASATADQTQSEINALGITATGLSGSPNITVGTINSGNITSTGTGNFGGKVTITNSAFDNHLRFVRSGQGDLYLTPSGQQLLLGNGGFSPAADNAQDLGRSGKNWQDLWLGSTLKMGGTTVLDSSRNLTNIGTISSGAISSTGLLKLDYTNPTLTFRPDNSAHFDIKANESPARLELGHSSNTSLYLSNTGNATFNYNLAVTGTTSSGQINATTSADATAAIIATNTGGVNSIIQRWVGDGDALDVRNIAAGDYQISNSQQTNGIDFYDNTAGLGFRYNNAVVAKISSTGGFDLVTGAYKINGTGVITDARVLNNITGFSGTSTTNNGYDFNCTDNTGDAGFTGMRVDHNVSGSDTLTADRTHRGLFVDQDSSATGGDTSNEHRLYGVQVTSTATGDSDLVYAINTTARAEHSSGTISAIRGGNFVGVADTTSTASQIIGVVGTAQKTIGGTVNSLYGVFGKSHILTANTTTNSMSAFGLYGEVELDSNTTLTNADAVRAVIDRDLGTITNGYLFRGSYEGTRPTNAYGVYIASDVKNYFAGTVTIGNNNPDQNGLNVHMADAEVVINDTNNTPALRLRESGTTKSVITTSSGALTLSSGGATVALTLDTSQNATFAGTISGTLASTVTATTQAASDNSTKVSTTAYVTTAIANLVDGAPSTLNTLNEIAAALNDDAALNTTLTNSIAGKLSLTGGTLSGNLAFSDDGEGISFYGGEAIKKTSGTGIVVTALSTRSLDTLLQIDRGVGGTRYGVYHEGYHPEADTLTTPRTIGGVSFDGSANINLPGVNTSGNQNTSGTAAGLSGTPNITVGTISSGAITASGKISGGGNVDTTPDADLHIRTSNLGGTAGDQQEIARFQTNLVNGGIVRVYTERFSNGTDWTTAQTKIQQRIDTTDMGYIQFNGSGNTYGIEIGTHGTAGQINLRHKGTVRLNTVNAGVNVTGALQVGGTTVIDSSRNLTNIGTISATGFSTNGNTGTFSNSVGSFPLVTSTAYDYVAKFESTDASAFIILEDNSSTNNANRIGVTGNDMKLVTNATTALTLDASQNAVFGGVVGIGGTSTNSNYGIWLQNNKWYAAQYSSSHDVVRMNANTAGGLDIYNQTDSAFAVIRTGGVNIGSTQVIDGSRNLTNIGTISSGAITSGAIDATSSVEEVIRLNTTGNTGAIHFRESDAVRGLIGFSNGTSIFGGADDQDMVFRSEAKLHLVSNVNQLGLTLNGGNATFGGTISSGAISSTGNSTFRGSGANSTNAFKVERASDNAIALRIQNSGEVVVENNYLYASHSGTAFYVQGGAVFRGGISNDTSGQPVTFNDDISVSGGFNATSAGSIPSIRGGGSYGGGIGFVDTNVSGMYTDGSGANLRLFTNQSGSDRADAKIGLSIDGSQRVGIGTVSPNQKLNVSGGRSYFGANGEAFAIGLGFNGTRTAANQTYFLGATDSATPDLQISNADGGEKVRITHAGNIGAGQTNPTLNINTNSSFFRPDTSGKFITINGGANGGFIMLESTTTTDGDQIGGLFWTRTAGQSDAHRQVAGIDAIQAVNSGASNLDGARLRFFTKPSNSGTNTPRMQIDQNGNIFVGSTIIIDQSRNLTNIGTISSKDITATQSNDAATNLTLKRNSATGRAQFALANESGSQLWRVGLTGAGGDDFAFYDGGANVLILDRGTNNATFAGTINSGNITSSGTGSFSNLVNALAYQVSGTQVISSARNLENIGTYSGTGNMTVAKSTTPIVVFETSATSGQDATLKIRGARTASNSSDIATIFLDNKTSSPYTMAKIIARDPSANHGLGNGQLILQTSSGGSLSNALVLDNSQNATFAGDVTAFSDERLKTNIETLDSKKALQMRGVSFIKDGVKGSGVIAQEIEKIAPELVLTADDEQGTKSVAYGNLVGYLIEAIKDQQKEIEYMKSELKTLKENNNGNK